MAADALEHMHLSPEYSNVISILADSDCDPEGDDNTNVETMTDTISKMADIADKTISDLLDSSELRSKLNDILSELNITL
jgi:hypothetical protein